MFSNRACSTCRARKVKCVPGARRCVRCTNMGIQDCVYDLTTKKRGSGKTLGMGEACQFCRIKKKKCDAKRPLCTTCLLSRNRPECVYDDEAYPEPASAIRSPSRGTYGHPPEQLGATDQDQVSTITSAHAPTDVSCSSSTQQVFEADRVPQGQSDLVLARRSSFEQPTSSDTCSPISIISPFLHSSIPPEPWIPLSFLGGEKLQVQISDMAATDLDMKSRVWTVIRLRKLGTQLSHTKMNALLRGDQSGTVLNRAFVCGAHVLGMMPSAGTDVTPAMVLLQARRLQTGWESLVEVFRGDDYRLNIQMAAFVASGFLYISMPQSALFYIQKGCDIIKAGNVRFTPACGHPPEFSDDLHEMLAALSQIIYWSNYMFLMCGGPEPHMTAKLEKEFRRELPDIYPVLFDICPLTMRTHGILLVRDAILLLGILPDDDAELHSWKLSCDRTLASLENYSRVLLNNITRFREVGDTSGADIISSSCIACLAQLAVLCDVAYRMDFVPGSGMCGLCDLALEKLGMLTSGFHPDEYTHLDLLLGYSWKESLSVCDARIRSLPPEESGSLRSCKKIIEEACSDFRTGLPNYEPPMIFSLALSVDGTTKDSKYPNLMEGEARKQYGL